MIALTFYAVIISVIIFFAVFVWKKSATNFSQILFVVVVVLMCILLLAHQGKLDQLIFKRGGTNLTVSFLKDLLKTDEIRKTIVEIYSKDFFTEIIKVEPNSDRWKILKKDGKIFLGLKLKYEPVLNTVEISTTENLIFSTTIGNFHEEGFYYILMEDSNLERTTGFVNLIKEKKADFYIKYLMKEKALSN